MKKKYSWVLLLSMILCLSACTTTKEITLVQAQSMQDGKFDVILRTRSRAYQLHDYKLTPDSLTGYLHPALSEYGTFIYFYTDKRIREKVNRRNHPYFAVHVNQINKTEYHEYPAESGMLLYCIFEILICAL